MIISFEKIIDRFILRHGIAGVVLKTKIVNDNECEISLRGGFSTTIEIVEDILYKDGSVYCRVEDLFG